jgi:glycine/D-amino acid oxidase-like deaminating enzyme
VVIVGGGITGIALLHNLRERGIDAVVCERGRVGSGASGRNAGFLLAGVAENYARAVARHGRGVAGAVWAFTAENHDLIAQLLPSTGAAHRRRGSHTVALDVAEADSLGEAAGMLADDGFTVELRDRDLPPGQLLALFNPRDGEIDPMQLVHALAAAHADRVFEDCDVTAIVDGDASAMVHARGHAIDAGAVVVATNAWTSQLLPSIDIRPVRAQMLAAAPAPRVVDAPTYAEWGHRYWRQRDDGSVLVGGFRHRALAAEVGFDATPTALLQHHLDAQLRDLGVATPVTHRWAGIMGFSPDGLPLVGRAPGCRRLHVCGGYTGHGMGFAVNAGMALTRWLVDSVPLPGWLDAARALDVSRSPTAP